MPRISPRLTPASPLLSSSSGCDGVADVVADQSESGGGVATTMRNQGFCRHRRISSRHPDIVRHPGSCSKYCSAAEARKY